MQHRKDGRTRLIQLVLYDPCGDDQPIDYIDRPRPDSKLTRHLFASAICKFNRQQNTTFVLGIADVTEQAYVRHPVDVSRYRSIKGERNRGGRKLNEH